MSYTQSDYSDCPALLRQFLFYLSTIKGRSQLTVENYYLDLRTFLRFMKIQKKLVSKDVLFDEITIDDIDADFLNSITLAEIYEFLNFTHRTRHNDAKARSRKVSALRTFFKYLNSNMQVIKNNPVEHLDLPSNPKSLPTYLTLEQSIDLLSSFDPEDEFYPRDYCMVVLFLNCGMRLAELTGLDLSNISDNTLRVLGKGNKERQLYLNDACMDALKTYLNYRSSLPNIIDTDALFLNRNKRRIGQRRVQQIVTDALKRAGLDHMGFSTHNLRHTAATMMYQHGGVDIRVLQEILGHENLNTTEIYTHVSSQQKETAFESNPLSKIKPKSQK